VSISHVTKWYGISNPFSWAIYLSVGIEIAALSALAAISANMGRKVYFPFGIVTLVQFIGNIFFAYQFIDVNNTTFQQWVELVDPLVSYLGVESGDLIGHKRFLALFSGGMLPLISLSFLHMLVKFEEEEKKKNIEEKIVKPELEVVVEKEIIEKPEVIEELIPESIVEKEEPVEEVKRLIYTK
jgi:phosphoglycerol transferase MdoB-like AlkP superfamily enzyme